MSVFWLSFRDLEYLVAVAQYGHFGKAAESTHVSQPALSSQIKKIEDSLGIEIFERTNRKVRITEIGQSVIEQARIVLEEARKMGELAKQAHKPLSGPFRLGVIASLGPYLLPYLLRPLRKKFPNVQLLLKEGLTESLIAELRDGSLDAVLASPTFSEGGLKNFPLFFEPFQLAAPKGHPLLGKSALKTTDLNSDDMILLEDGHCLKDQVMDICPSNRRGRIQQFHATSLETLRHMVASGLGYTVLPALSVQENEKLKGLLGYRHFDNRSAGRIISLFCRERSAQFKDIELFADFVRKTLPAEVHPLK